MQYGAAATLIAAVEDFLQGPDTLRDGGISTLPRIRELRAAYPETRCHQATSAPGIASNDIVIVNAPARPRARDIALLASLFTPIHRDACGAVPHDEAHWWHVARFRTAVVTDASQKGVRIRRYDRRLMATLAKAGARALTRLAVNGGNVREQYRRALPELSSRETWARLYKESGE
jgi:galactofuranosylgalactofuranosylrhamnosyl-N-acetylglucosaminyl-diphospho-decaprenol beta-1,5/1,6-galactofuranosyltransferase